MEPSSSTAVSMRKTTGVFTGTGHSGRNSSHVLEDLTSVGTREAPAASRADPLPARPRQAHPGCGLLLEAPAGVCRVRLREEAAACLPTTCPSHRSWPLRPGSVSWGHFPGRAFCAQGLPMLRTTLLLNLGVRESSRPVGRGRPAGVPAVTFVPWHILEQCWTLPRPAQCAIWWGKPLAACWAGLGPAMPAPVSGTAVMKSILWEAKPHTAFWSNKPRSRLSHRRGAAWRHHGSAPQGPSQPPCAPPEQG